MELGKTQQNLAEEIGLTFQQVQKYELGVNRVAAPYLWAISNALEVRVDYFFAGLDVANQQAPQDGHDGVEGRLLAEGQTLRLVRCFRKLNASQRNAILGLVVSMLREDRAENSESSLD